MKNEKIKYWLSFFILSFFCLFLIRCGKQEKTQNSYWLALTNEIKSYFDKQAISWLKADKAYQYCKKYHDQFSSYHDGELYGALGLQYLYGLGDLRLRIDIMQRLQLILYYFQGMHDLSIAIAENLINDAIKNQYFLREIGLSYQKADAQMRKGNNKVALNDFHKILKKIELIQEMPSVRWYEKNIYFLLAQTYWQSGQYDSSASICNRLEASKLDKRDKILLHIQRGLIHRNLGRYDSAKSEYIKALNLSKETNDHHNELLTLNDLGYLYFEISEYDKALDYYDQINDIILKHSPENYYWQVRIFIEIAKVYMEKKDLQNSISYINQASELTKNLEFMDVRKANYLATIGSLNLEMNNKQGALDNFKESVKICQNNGLFRLALKYKLKQSECLMKLKEYEKARNIISEVKTFAEKIRDNENIIFSQSLLAELLFLQGDTQSAVAVSSELIPYVERIISDMKDDIRMISFFQKIYDHLKNGVFYQIIQKNNNQALAYLDYAKSRFLLEQMNPDNSDRNDQLTFFKNNIISLNKSITEHHLVINYMILNDTLYAFVLDNEGLQLLKKPINIDELNTKVTAYTKNITDTPQIFKSYNQNLLLNHFEKTCDMGAELYDILLGWPLVQSKLEKTDLLYIIPDEFLHTIPFSTLMANSLDRRSYIIHQTAIQIMPGCSFIRSIQNRSEKQNLDNKRVLISANPEFKKFKEVVSFIKQIFPLSEELIVDKLPIKKTDIFNKLSKSNDILIVFGHGQANSKYPELSNIEFTVRSSLKKEVKTFRISLDDLRRNKILSSEMVMLIGCETAAGKLYRSSGISGLQQMFLTLGFKHVLASHWKIDTAHAIPQVKSFLTLIKQRQTGAYALQDLQRKTINMLENDDYYQVPHPYFWGSFVLSSITN